MQREDWSGICGVGGVRAVLGGEGKRVPRVGEQRGFIPEEVGGGHGC